METQAVEKENTPVRGVGEYQSKLAVRLRDDFKLFKDSYLFNKKSRHVSAPVIARALLQFDGLEFAVKTMIDCLETHEDREDFAKSVLAAMNV